MDNQVDLQNVAGGLNTASPDVSSGFLGLGTSSYNIFGANPKAWDTGQTNKYQQLSDQQLSNLSNRKIAQAQVPGAIHTALANSLNSDWTAINESPQNQFRFGEQRLAGELEDQASGNGPTLAERRLKEATDRGMAQSLGLASSVHGNNPGMALRAAMDNQARIQGEAAQQESDLTQQEQMNARSQLGSVLNQSRGADIGLAEQQAGLTQSNQQFNASLGTNVNLANAGALNTSALTGAQLQQQTNVANLQASIEQQKHIDSLTQKYIDMGYSMAMAKQQAAVDYQKFQASSLAQQEAAKHNVAIQVGAQQAQVAGASAQALGSAIAAAA